MASRQELAAGAEFFPHVRVAMVMVIGLAAARRLSDAARMVQHRWILRLFDAVA
jgi:hypothetical protein